MNHWALLCLLAVILLVASHVWILLRVIVPLRRLVAQTGELTQGNLSALDCECGGIAEIDQLRRSMAGMVGHVRRAEEQRHAYTRALSSGQEAERRRLAHDLHDDTVQSFIAIARNIDLAMTWLGDAVAPRAEAVLKQARTQATDAVESLRLLIANLRPPALDELGLVAAVNMLATGDGPDIHVETEGVERRLDEAHELTLFRATQEALENARRHSQATHVDVRIAYQPDSASVTIHDNGAGFTPPPRLDEFAAEAHYGLIGMRERAHHLNGTMAVQSAPGKGTTITVTLPLSDAAQPEDTARDPVCSALINPQQAYGSLEYEGQRYYFCCPVCQGTFQKSPENYAVKP